MADFTRQDLAGARFEQVDLTGARFRNVDLTHAVIRGALLVNVEIDGLLQDVTVNGVDVVPLVEAELDRRYPDRAKMRPADADGYRQAWEILARLWQQTVDRARGMDPDLLHERVDDEWSFLETLRHLVFADDIWVGRMLSDEPGTFHPLGVPPTDTTDAGAAQMGLTLSARAPFVEVADLHQDRRRRFTALLDGVADVDLFEVRTAVLAPDWGEESFPVFECLRVVIGEHAEHLRFALRDLAVLEARPVGGVHAGSSSPSSQTASSESTR